MATSPPRQPSGPSPILVELLNLGVLRIAQDGVTILGPDNQAVSTGGGGGSGTVTSVAALTVGTAGTDITSTVANPTTTPVISLQIPSASATNRGALTAADWTAFNAKQTALGFTPLNAASNLSDLASASAARTSLGLGTLATQSGTFSGTSSGTNTGDQTNITGNAATVTTNANLTGPITSTGNATAVASQTGTGTKFVMDTNPTIKGLEIVSNNAAALPTPPTGTVLQLGAADTVGTRAVLEAFAAVPVITMRRADGTAAAPSAVQLNESLGSLHFSGYGATAYGSGRSALSTFAAENWTDTAQGAYVTLNTTPTGTLTSTEQMRLLGNGNIGHGVTAPTAVVHVKAGTAAAGTAPVKLNQGVLLTTPEDGTLEYDAGSNLWFTLGSTRTPLTGSNLAKATQRRKKPIVGFAGDSIANFMGTQTFGRSSLQWLISRYYNADIFWDQRAYASGGYNYGTSGATTTTMFTTPNQLSQIQTRTPDILIMNGGTNDLMTTAANVTTAYNNLTTFINGALAAGVQLVMYFSILPRSSNSTHDQANMECNRKVRVFCDSTPGCYFVDMTQYFIDPTSTTYAPLGGSGGLAGATTQEGLHQSTFGAQMSASALLEVISQVCRVRRPRAVMKSEPYDNTNAPHGNFLGTAGSMLVTTGGTLDGVTNTGVADGWAIVSPTNTVVVVPTVVTSAYLPGGYKAQNITFTGTPNANGSMTMTYTAATVGHYFTTENFAFEAVIRMNNVVNASVPSVTCNAIGGGTSGLLIDGTSEFNLSQSQLAPSGDYYLFVYEGAPVPPGTFNFQIRITFTIWFVNGLAPTGNIELGFAGAYIAN